DRGKIRSARAQSVRITTAGWIAVVSRSRGGTAKAVRRRRDLASHASWSFDSQFDRILYSRTTRGLVTCQLAFALIETANPRQFMAICPVRGDRNSLFVLALRGWYATC